ncbi:hypothetical protein CP533_2765 [Ophiocordyceps camponoti-saundersi (nom. inval.)]|nr:hypothetical protein CP533_2765 [Ophiocordyceps camponoti-saundersi (nom. inval.)]
MDKQATDDKTTPPPTTTTSPPSPPPSPSVSRRDLPSTTKNALPPQTFPPSTTASSEPCLRFPRPQGNRHLANWVSASDPDIMLSVSVSADDIGLAGSSYELINGTDSESQDGNYTESVADSVGSLEPRRSDDVHSLDGTEDTYDGDSLPGDDESPFAQPGKQGTGHSADEARSRESLEYTQHSLGTPSIITPDTSRLLPKPPNDVGGEYEENDVIGLDGPLTVSERLAHLCRFCAQICQCLILEGLPTMALTCIILALITTLFSPHVQNVTSPASTVAPIATTASPAPLIASTVQATTRSRPHPSPSGGMGLISLDDDEADDWLLGPKKQRISFSPMTHTDILVHVPADVKQNWLAKNCLAVSAIRQGHQVETTSSPVDEGILLRFPRKEAYGVVDLSLEATCRPRVQRLIEVHFGKGVMEEALEMTRNLAHDISYLVPAAAQEAERCLEGAKRSLGAVSDSFGNSLLSLSDGLFKKLGSAVAGARQSVEDGAKEAMDRLRVASEGLPQRATERATDQLRQVQNRLQLTLLRAQVSAKIWWLGATGRKEEHDDYRRKAADFLSKKFAAVHEARRRHDKSSGSHTTRHTTRFWHAWRPSGKCHGGRGKSSGGCATAAG